MIFTNTRQDEIPKLVDDLQIPTYVLKAYLKEDYEIRRRS